MLLDPAATPLASPPVVIVATPALMEVQVTELVRFCVVLSEKVPVAANCSEVPFAIERLGAVTAIDTNAAAVTVRVAEDVTFPEVACIALVPTAAAVTDPVAVIVATLGVSELHVTEPDKFRVVWSEKVPVAVNCSVVPFAIERFGAVTAMEIRVGLAEDGE
jgi:hypothetical protein